MGTYHSTLTFQTSGNCDMVDITSEVENVVRASGFKNGICTVFCVGSTGSIVTIEYEEGLLKDFPEAMERLAPVEAVYEHHLRWQDGNGHSHIRASIVGPSLTAPFVDGRLTLGTWQQIAFVDFDNRSRSRRVEVMLVGE
ncbi:MAG: secondary thiamine-phosphate synthase enzyme YjbQ [Candidatus Thorarchaeota archaeon]|nr:secondary thiamine-phosphate synthase enzyme YjbQ [Candidatus Thorarchaeota archaeon]